MLYDVAFAGRFGWRRAACVLARAASARVAAGPGFFTRAGAFARAAPTLGARVSAPQAEPDHGVTVVFVELPNAKIELLHPLGTGSPVPKFLERNPGGGMHHLCYEVDDIIAARDALQAKGARVLGGGEPKIGAHGKPVLSLHPKDFSGALIEIEQA